mgnify:FL=1
MAKDKEPVVTTSWGVPHDHSVVVEAPVEPEVEAPSE